MFENERLLARAVSCVAIVDLLETSHYLFQRARVRKTSTFNLLDERKRGRESALHFKPVVELTLILYGAPRKAPKALTSE